MDVTKLHNWHDIKWLDVELTVKQLRGQIFLASRSHDYKAVGNLQKTMLRSSANLLLSVRRVTQVNKGRSTPGVDKKVYETPAERLALAKEVADLRLNDWQPPPTKRVLLPKKKGKKAKRPIGIPTQKDRIIQTMVKNALEPAWEAKFEHHSYGYRPGRSTMDAITAVYYALIWNNRPVILDADVKGAFDNFRHSPILVAISNSPTRFLIEKWLKAGVMIGVDFTPTPFGTPQGGAASPLLANIALHGLETELWTEFRNRPANKQPVYVRYADDFVIMCATPEDGHKALEVSQRWLAKKGLAFSPEKTAIRHIAEGFDFLGFNVRCYDRPKSSKKGYKLEVRPAKENIKKLKVKLKDKFRTGLHKPPKMLIAEINPIITGWANYYRSVVVGKTFNHLDYFLYNRIWRYAHRRHPTKSKKWLKPRYFSDDWRLKDKNGAKSRKFWDYPFKRWVRLRHLATPDNPEEEDYWNTRRSKATPLLRMKAALWKRQKGLCERCQGILDNGEEIVVHHRDRNRENWKFSNLELIHDMCHQKIHHQRTA